MIKLLVILLMTPTLILGEGIQGFKLESVYDGDTFFITIPSVKPNKFHERISIRIKGIDTPEIKTKCKEEKYRAFASKAILSDLLFNANEITIKEVEKDKYFRVLAKVYVDGISVGDYMIKEGYATFYDGGPRDRMTCFNKWSI